MKYKLFSKTTNISVTDTATQTDVDTGTRARTGTRTAGDYVNSSRLALRVRGGCCSTRGIEYVTILPPTIYLTLWGNQVQDTSRGRSSRSRSGNCGGGGGGSSGGDGGGGGCGGGGGGGGGNGGG
ncbi:hypothetical protein V865_002946 [Kwoniella europaea PYCC6329]|uniref:Uncharacterized protein n=1 Tax=Kwoniella europaea PYCC6329 TaxID=1423913 RepID=A0AAX4KH31_9TREE